MLFRNIYKGMLTLEDDYNGHECLLLNGENIHDVLDDIKGLTVTIKYYTSDIEATEEVLTEDFLVNTLYGEFKSKFNARYSEMTGYLWTDDDLQIGGHNLRDELESYEGKYLYLIAEGY